MWRAGEAWRRAIHPNFRRSSHLFLSNMNFARARGYRCSWVVMLNVDSFVCFQACCSMGRHSRLDPPRVFMLMHTHTFVFGAQVVTPAGGRHGGKGSLPPLEHEYVILTLWLWATCMRSGRVRGYKGDVLKRGRRVCCLTSHKMNSSTADTVWDRSRESTTTVWLIDLVAPSCQVVEPYKLIAKLLIKTTVILWRTMFSACGDADFPKRIFDRFLKLHDSDGIIFLDCV
jgi:hypothetical protein